MAVFVRAARFCIRMQANSALFNQPSNNLSKIFGFMMTKDNRCDFYILCCVESQKLFICLVSIAGIT